MDFWWPRGWHLSAACISDMLATPLAAAPADKCIFWLHMSSEAAAKGAQHQQMLGPRPFQCQSAANQASIYQDHGHHEQAVSADGFWLMQT